MKINGIKPQTPYQYGTLPAFCAMKSSQFEGLDYSCMRKFKAPIEKFKSLNDFYNWVNTAINKKTNRSLTGKTEGTELKRQNLLNDWREGLQKYSPAISLLTLTSILKNIKSSNDTLPPVFHNTIFEETVADLEGAVALERDFQFDMSKVYKQHLKSTFLSDSSKNKDGWITIPSGFEDKNTEKNAGLLNLLSRKTWCTKGVKSEIYIKTFGFRIFVKDGEPEVCLRMAGNIVCEIQGRLNDYKIPEEYKSIVIDYIEENELEIDCDTEAELYG